MDVPISDRRGNTYILKPSPLTPLSAMRAADLFYECDFPTGTLNVVHGDKDAVDALITHKDVRAVSFVGSSKVARHIQQLAVEHHKRVQALGGAKNHLIVMPDGVSETTRDAIMSSAFGGAGERCLAGSAARPSVPPATTSCQCCATPATGLRLGLRWMSALAWGQSSALRQGRGS